MAVGGIDTSGAAAATSKAATKSNTTDSLDKDAFLQLLVTQMQNQDPLSPSDNTEYMSQLAQFSSLEAMNNLNSNTTNNQAMNLAGRYVIMNTTDSAGNTSQVSGLVDYVTIADGKAKLSISGTYYSIDDLDSVVSLDYLEYLSKQNGDSDGKTDKTDDKTDKTDSTTGNESEK